MRSRIYEPRFLKIKTEKSKDYLEQGKRSTGWEKCTGEGNGGKYGQSISYTHIKIRTNPTIFHSKYALIKRWHRERGIKCLLSKHEDLNSDPQHPTKTGQGERVFRSKQLGGRWVDSLLGRSSERPPQKVKWRGTEEDIQCWLLASMYMYVHTHTCTHIHRERRFIKSLL